MHADEGILCVPTQIESKHSFFSHYFSIFPILFCFFISLYPRIPKSMEKIILNPKISALILIISLHFYKNLFSSSAAFMEGSWISTTTITWIIELNISIIKSDAFLHNVIICNICHIRINKSWWNHIRIVSIMSLNSINNHESN